MGSFKIRLADGRPVYVDDAPSDEGVYRGHFKHTDEPVKVRWDGEKERWLIADVVDTPKELMQALYWDHLDFHDHSWRDEERTEALVAERDVRLQAKALRAAADEMDDTDDPDAIYVNNGDIDAWLRARADRLEEGLQ